MPVEERIRRCLILEKMKNNKEAARNLGLKNTSKIKAQAKHQEAGRGKGW